MRDGGWNLDVIGYFDNSLVDSKQEETGSYEVTRSEFCNKSSSELTQTLGVDFLETNGEFAFDAFKQCVEETNSNVTALSYEFVGGGAGQLIAGELSRFINGQQQNLPYELYGFAVTPASANVECTFLAEGIPDGLSRDTPVEIQETPAGFTCLRSDDVSIVLDIQTTQGSFRVISPSSAQVEQTKVEQLQNELMALRSELSNTRIELEANLESVLTTSASGDRQIQTYAEQVNSVAQAALKPGDRVRLKSREGILISNNRQNQDEKDLLIEPRNPVPGGNIDYVWWELQRAP